MTFLTVNYENQSSILESFDKIAQKIANEVQLKINDSVYRIVDFEFYTFSKNFPDPYTYKNDLQLQTNKLYLHASGIDITFGDGFNHGGILLRSIVKLSADAGLDAGFMSTQYDGPQIVATELFKSLYALNSFEKNEISLVDIKGHNQDALFKPSESVIKTKRVGLTLKPADLEDFYKNVPVRYIAILPKFKNFKQTIKGIENILKDKVLSGEMAEEIAVSILGYKKSFK